MSGTRPHAPRCAYGWAPGDALWTKTLTAPRCEHCADQFRRAMARQVDQPLFDHDGARVRIGERSAAPCGRVGRNSGTCGGADNFPPSPGVASRRAVCDLPGASFQFGRTSTTGHHGRTCCIFLALNAGPACPPGSSIHVDEPPGDGGNRASQYAIGFRTTLPAHVGQVHWRAGWVDGAGPWGAQVGIDRRRVQEPDAPSRLLAGAFWDKCSCQLDKRDGCQGFKCGRTGRGEMP